MISTVMARNWTLAGNGADSDALGRALGLTGVREWQLDEAFLDGISNRETLKDIAKENDIALPGKITMKAMRALLLDKVPETWRPSWLSF